MALPSREQDSSQVQQSSQAGLDNRHNGYESPVDALFIQSQVNDLKIVDPRSASTNASASLLQRPQPIRHARYRHLDVFKDGWWWEVLGCLLSLLCLIAIAILLVVYDQKKPPSLRMGLTVRYEALFATRHNLTFTVQRYHFYTCDIV